MGGFRGGLSRGARAGLRGVRGLRLSAGGGASFRSFGSVRLLLGSILLRSTEWLLALRLDWWFVWSIWVLLVNCWLWRWSFNQRSTRKQKSTSHHSPLSSAYSAPPYQSSHSSTSPWSQTLPNPSTPASAISTACSSLLYSAVAQQSQGVACYYARRRYWVWSEQRCAGWLHWWF